MAGSGTSVGLPMPRSMTSMPARRLAYFRALILPNKYGGRRLTRSATLTWKGRCGVFGSFCMVLGSRCRGADRPTGMLSLSPAGTAVCASGIGVLHRIRAAQGDCPPPGKERSRLQRDLVLLLSLLNSNAKGRAAEVAVR